MIHQAKSSRPLLDEQIFQSGLHPLPARPSGAYGAGKFDSGNLRDDLKMYTARRTGSNTDHYCSL